MNRGVVFLIILLTVVVFVGLVYYGWINRWGGDMDTTVTPPLVLTMPMLEKTLDLTSEEAFDNDVWRVLEPLAVPMLHQVTKPPYARNLVPIVNVRAFHNDSEVYFLLEWSDVAASGVHDIEEFPDAVAVGLPLGDEPPSGSIMMGFLSPVNIWQWKADLDAVVWGPGPPDRHTANVNYSYLAQADIPTAAEEVTSACQDLVAIRPGTLTPKEQTSVTGRGLWHNGEWRVIIKRPLATDDAERDVQLSPGRMHVTFAVWDGDKGDRGSRKSISEWIILDIKPSVDGSSSSRSPAAAVTAGMPLATVAWPTLLATAADADEEPRVITISAKRFEYTPSEITLQKGELVTFRLVSEDVTHGLFIDGYDINMKVHYGEVATTTFRADQPGRFTFRCSETCGTFHPYMIGYLNVVPNNRHYVFLAVVAGMFVLLAIFALVKGKRKEAAGHGG